MKFQITFKDPNTVDDSINEIVTETFPIRNFNVEGVPSNKKSQEQNRKSLKKEIDEKLEKWIDCGEYVTIEFDTDMNTTRVVGVNENIPF
jgi:hypothetical protein